MFTDNFCRYEFKFPVSYDTMDRLMDDLDPYVSKDSYANEFGYYCLSSIYFDNDENQCYHETMNGIRYRQKVRLRIYRSCGSLSSASKGTKDEDITDEEPSFFEIKAKINGLVTKRRVKMTLGNSMRFTEYNEKLMADGKGTEVIFTEENTEKLKTFASSNLQILRELQYVILNKRLHPRNVVSYERLALFCTADPELRVTFDINIRTRGDDLDLAKGTRGEPSTPEETAILEVKTGKEIPLWLVKILSKYKYKNMTFSKYCSYFVEMLPEGPLYGAYVKAEHLRTGSDSSAETAGKISEQQ